MPVPRTRPSVTFQGVTYGLDNDGYYKTGKTRGHKVRLLHRDVWAAANGPIPDGWHVHHVDHDRDNNDPSNLQALPAAVHNHHHAPDRGWGTWSDERRRTSRRKEWASREPTERTCLNCGGTYLSTGQRAKYCTVRCRIDYNRERIRELERARYRAAKLQDDNGGSS
jgi:hypothetical protein